MNYELVVSRIREQLKKYIQEHNIKSLVLGVSGGMDSCVCAALAKPVCDELNIPLIGRSLPIFSNKSDEVERAQMTGRAFCTHFEEDRSLEAYYELMSGKLNPQPYTSYDGLLHDDEQKQLKAWKIRGGNIKARLRMIYLYNLASQNNGMVLSTDNYTEYLLGFWTLHGDVGDYGMIQQLWKSEVYDLGEWLIENETTWTESQKKALKSCIDCQATDGLGISNTDLDQILPGWEGSSREGYKKVDEILQNYQMEYAISDGLMEYVDMTNPVVIRHRSSDFKRKNPYNISREDLFKGVS